MFGKSITRPSKPPARHLEPVPPLPTRAVMLALLAVMGSAYAIVRHYTRVEPPPRAQPAEMREVPAPEVVPVER